MIRSSLLAILTMMVFGCGAEPEPTTSLVAVDCSGSAQAGVEGLQKGVRSANETLRGVDRLELYRFDTEVNEMHVGGPLDAPGLKAQFPTLSRDRQERGTNLRKLAERLDERIAAAGTKSVDLTILTDCGIEGMSRADHDRVKALAKGWGENSKVRNAVVAGVKPFHRDALRADLNPLGAKLTIR